MKLRRRPHLAGGILKGWSHSEKAKMFSVDADLCLRKTQAGKYHDHRNVIESEKCRFQMFSSTVKRAPAFSIQNPPVWRAFLKSSVFETDYCGRQV